jgi:hypothetical protein
MDLMRAVLGPLPCIACRRVVRWVRIVGRFVLVEADGSRHTCPPRLP